ncbi:hypothetical protein [Cellulomonas pakistanensis]|uniref:Uncharacterized protein n=1 Tax=Cellulomonas pakistanensis TaxID=992287 RepID=A0A919U443_9CELL|nr:hypothetical protein [Cellulomonas pakistanensis]GIG37943.1 hypothetical protein Cpa01nite_33240 [Cellulomonas pakistanensis]
MSAGDTTRTPKNTVVYAVAAGLLILLVLVALLTFREARQTARAEDRADELIAVLEEAGVERLPSRENVVRVLGEDGGAACQDPAHGLRQATLHSMLMNGASGPGMRPVITDSRLLQGQLAIMEVYCPDELDAVRAQLDELRTADVVGG